MFIPRKGLTKVGIKSITSCTRDKYINLCTTILFLLISRKKLDMCQYDTDAPAQGHPQLETNIVQKKKFEKGNLP